MARLFVAARLPADALDLIAAELAASGSSGRWVGRDQWHVTLRFLGEADPAATAHALATLQAPAVEATLGEASVRLGRRVLALPVDGLDRLAASVDGLLERAGIEAEQDEDRPFRGHVTVARASRRGGLPPLELSEDYRAAPARRFVVREVELVRSELARDGARHTVELTQPLFDPPA